MADEDSPYYDQNSEQRDDLQVGVDVISLVVELLSSPPSTPEIRRDLR